MKILVFNCGSSSLKYQLICLSAGEKRVRGKVERLGTDQAVLVQESPSGKRLEMKGHFPDISHAIDQVLRLLTDPEYGALSSLKEIAGIGHRVVHGGESFKEPVLIDSMVLEGIRKHIFLAPLHNPANLQGILACQERLPGVPQVAVFDTAFHQTLEKHVYLYGIPYEDYEQYGIRKYGFHGISHEYIARFVENRLGLGREKLICCHLGSGASLCAIRNGISVDTTMGLSPLEGLMMGTRTGDLDPFIPSFLMRLKEFSYKELERYLNQESGALGLSGVSNDFRDIIARAGEGHQRAIITLEKYTYMIKKYIGAYAAAMNGLSVLVFTAGQGENSPWLRSKICENLDFLGVDICPEKNEIQGQFREISTGNSRVRVFVIPTDEEWLIGEETGKILDRRERGN